VAINGSCLCGAVRYEITGSFHTIGHCHCTTCRKSLGAAFATWGLLAPGQFRWTAGEACVGTYATSPGREKCFCTTCGTALASQHDGHVGEVVLGTVDGDPGGRPREHIFVRSKAAWYEIADDLPRFETWPLGMALD
jgi:hypothetical protein